MKLTKALLCILLGLTVLTACGKEEDPKTGATDAPSLLTEAPETPEATAHTHAYEKQESASNVACNEYIQEVYVCASCGDRYSEPTDQKGTAHHMKVTVVPPTKETGGYTQHACQRCDYSYTDTPTNPVTYSTGLSYEKRSNGWYVTDIGSCADLHITVPAVNELGNKVAGIAANAFVCLPILSLTVEDGVADLENHSVGNCKQLTSITLPKGIKPQENCFFLLPALETLSMPFSQAIPYYFNTGGDAGQFLQVKVSISDFPYAHTGMIPLSLKTVHILGSSCAAATLKGCSMIQTVTVAQTIRQLPAGIFSGCSALESITFSDALISIGNKAFQGTAIREIRIPDGVTLSISNESMFAECTQLVSVTLPKNATAIGVRMFMGCTALTSIEIPQSVKSIGDGAFFKTSISSITLPNGITQLYVGVFSDCSNLQAVTLPNALTQIDRQCFQNCISLKAISLPATVTEIGDNAFEGSGLTSLELPEGLKRIGEKAFYSCRGLESVIFPASLTAFGPNAFGNCEGLKNVEFRSAELPTGSGVFSNTPLLTTVVLPETVTKIPHSFFSGATGLKQITLPKSVTHLCGSAFRGCTALETVDLSGAAITYGDGSTPWNTYVFAGCTSLTQILNDENVVQSYDETVFQDTPLQTIENGLCIGNGLLIWARLANSVTSVTVPATVRTVRATAFYQNLNLTEVIFSEGLQTLENAVFSECASLKRVVLPNSLIKIHQNAFGSCYVTELECGASVIPLLEKVTLPATLQTIRFQGTAAEWNTLFPTLPPSLEGITVLFTEE